MKPINARLHDMLDDLPHRPLMWRGAKSEMLICERYDGSLHCTHVFLPAVIEDLECSPLLSKRSPNYTRRQGPIMKGLKGSALLSHLHTPFISVILTISAIAGVACALGASYYSSDGSYTRAQIVHLSSTPVRVNVQIQGAEAIHPARSSESVYLYAEHSSAHYGNMA